MSADADCTPRASLCECGVLSLSKAITELSNSCSGRSICCSSYRGSFRYCGAETKLDEATKRDSRTREAPSQALSDVRIRCRGVADALHSQMETSTRSLPVLSALLSLPLKMPAPATWTDLPVPCEATEFVAPSSSFLPTRPHSPARRDHLRLGARNQCLASCTPIAEAVQTAYPSEATRPAHTGEPVDSGGRPHGHRSHSLQS
jgi:hypothetical protein